MPIGANELFLLVPLILLELGLAIFAYIDLAKRKAVRGGHKWVWAIVILLGIIGPILYFLVGRSED